ncbi:protein-export chaperone SecB [Roseovarius amoyensis]|uniref:protein-export chaperone SecB n=1 Tax=Roseovarius amoyensis TaxID=2211448 RepID=UPI000DBE8152|nr:protein-export chaperone SecB [Roseovarius amoyensis]
MIEQTNGDATSQEGQQKVKMSVLTQFVRDLSFENVLAQKGTGGEVTPEMTVGVSLDARKRSVEGQYEVVTKLQIGSKNKGTDQQLFLMEMEYAGVFHIEGVPAEQLHPFLMIECPRLLFPFMRRIVSDVTRDGGFPPLNLENIDWVQLYRQQLADLQAKTGEAPKADA